jgi:hypothetical protein
MDLVFEIEGNARKRDSATGEFSLDHFENALGVAD